MSPAFSQKSPSLILFSRWHNVAEPSHSFPYPAPLTLSKINTNHVSLFIFPSFLKYCIASYCPISCCFFDMSKLCPQPLQQKRVAYSPSSLHWCVQSHRDATNRNLPSHAHLRGWLGSGQCKSAVADASRFDGGVQPNPPFCPLTPPKYSAFARQRA